MSAAGPAAALALKTKSKLSAADNDFAATAAAGQALNAANGAAAAAAAAAAPAAAAAAAGPAAALALKAQSRLSAADNDMAGNTQSPPQLDFQGHV